MSSRILILISLFFVLPACTNSEEAIFPDETEVPAVAQKKRCDYFDDSYNVDLIKYHTECGEIIPTSIQLEEILRTGAATADPIMVKYALDNGANPSGTSEFSFNEERVDALALASIGRPDDAPLLFYGSSKQRTEVIKLLLDHGAPLNAQGFFGDSALLYAASNNDVEVAKLLLEYGADPNIQRSNGRTPLIRAVLRDHEEVTRLLLAFGADLEIEDQLGLKALNYSANCIFRDFRIANILLEAGADPESIKDEGKDERWRCGL